MGSPRLPSLGRCLYDRPMMQTTYTGPPLDDPALLDRLPEDLGSILRQENGWIRFDGGLHLRGACREPSWHSLRVAWEGLRSFAALYPRSGPRTFRSRRNASATSSFFGTARSSA